MFSRYSLIALLVPLLCQAANELRWLPEYLRPDPFGGIVQPDRVAGEQPRAASIRLRGARDGYVSCHLLVSTTASGTLSVELNDLEPELFREWFHYMPSHKTWYPDALIPARSPVSVSLPDADNKITGQEVQAVWLDIWIPKNARAGRHTGSIVLRRGASTAARLPIEVDVLAAVVPENDVVLPDHNSYGLSWVTSQYSQSTDLFQLIHAHHRIFYEHRGVFHQLGYGHGGKVAPEFAPELTGTGRTKSIASWDLFDRHYGPLLDGSAFAGSRRGPRPIPFVYLPINPEWPASFLSWGEEGYEAEFINVVRQMEEHFRQKNWTRTNFELFFNHKKRYKAFPWDGDETRFTGDNKYFLEYHRLMKKAMPSDTPVKWVFRTDTSWTMAEQFKKLEGVINFWVASGGMLSLYDWAPAMIRNRKEILWTYGGTPEVDAPASAIATELLKAWLWGASGYVHWLTVSPGPDPWFQFSGGGTALVYPGTRFGINEPIPSIRLKLQRNIVQDLNLMEAAKDNLRLAEVTRRFNGTTPDNWWTRNSPLLRTKPLDWNNTDIDEALQPLRKTTAPSDAASWDRVRSYLDDVIAGGR